MSYLPIDCPACGRHRLLTDGSCEKCGADSETINYMIGDGIHALRAHIAALEEKLSAAEYLLEASTREGVLGEALNHVAALEADLAIFASFGSHVVISLPGDKHWPKDVTLAENFAAVKAARGEK